jgi:hypothetical protein
VDVIDLPCDRHIGCGRSPAGDAAEFVAQQHAVSQSRSTSSFSFEMKFGHEEDLEDGVIILILAEMILPANAGEPTAPWCPTAARRAFPSNLAPAKKHELFFQGRANGPSGFDAQHHPAHHWFRRPNR